MYPVLVAEDEPWIRGAIVEMVGRLGSDFDIVGAATNGEEAWALIHDTFPLILICDIMMPQMDGLELIQKISESQLPLSCIVISGYDNFQYARKAMSYGVTDYLLKPVDFGELQAALLKSRDKLEAMKDLQSHIAQFQGFLDQLKEEDAKSAFRQLTRVLEPVLKLKYLNPAARRGLLTIFERKLVKVLRDLDLKLEAHKGLSEEQDQAIVDHFRSLTECWMVHDALQNKQKINSIINQACKYIREHYAMDISLTQMAKMTNMSISHFCSSFKQQTGLTMVNYIHQIRIEESKRLLVESDLKVFEIAEKIGFSSLSYFTRVFKQAINQSPNEYRKSLGL